MRQRHADLYLALAEVLGEPPPWLARPGREWPLYTAAAALAPASAAAARALPALARVGAESPAARRNRYRSLFAGQGRPRFWLYESLYRSGQILGPETHMVGQLYEMAGLPITDGELPDHASLELAFLAYLARQPALDPGHASRWQRLERQFIVNHAGRWLPDLGRGLATSGDPVYAPIGRLLTGWIEEMTRRPQPEKRAPRLPQVRQTDCTLCGFCVQMCPTRALVIVEDEHETCLSLLVDRCSGCGRCTQHCETGALTLRSPAAFMGAARQPLRRSPRVPCRGCGQPTVSRAELDFVAGRLGRPRWLEYCLSCRARLLEKDNELSYGVSAL